MKWTSSELASKTLWYVLWGAMALLAVTGVLAPTSICSEKYRFLFGVLLAAIGMGQLVLGVTFLSRREAALAAVALLLFGAGQGGLRLSIGGSPGIDFGAYYVAGSVASENPPGRLYYQRLSPNGRIDMNPASEWQKAALHYGVSTSLPFIYPPFLAVLMKPFAHFSYDDAYALWRALAVFLTIASILISLSLGGKKVSIELALILIVGIFAYYPFGQELLVGQVEALILVLCAGGIWLISRNSDWLSALCFAVATMIKITPVIAIPLLAFHRKWKWLTAYGCWLVCLLAFSIWQTGWAAHAQFLHGVTPSISCGITTSGNVSIVAFIQELFLGYVPFNVSQPMLPPLACAVSKEAALAIYGAYMARSYFRRHEQALVRHLILLVLLSIAISPISWWHTYTIALLPFIYLWCTMAECRKDLILLATVLVVGTNVTEFALPLVSNHVAQLTLAAIVPCLTIMLAYLRIPLEVSANPAKRTPPKASKQSGLITPS